MRYSLRLKMLTAAGLVILTSALVGWAGIAGLETTKFWMDELFSDEIPTFLGVNRIQGSFLYLNDATLSTILDSDTAQTDLDMERVRKIREDLHADLEKMSAHVANDPELKDAAGRLTDALNKGTEPRDWALE